VGNFFIDMINALFKIVNLLPFMNLAYIEHLQTVKQVTENAKKLTTGQSSLTDTIAYLNSKLKEVVDKQLTTYKDMYEAGLINATEYAARVKEANAQIPNQNSKVSASDQALTDISDLAKRINDLTALQASLTQGIIDKTTGAVIAYTNAQKQAILDGFGLVMDDSAATTALQAIQGQIDAVLAAMANPIAGPALSAEELAAIAAAAEAARIKQQTFTGSDMGRPELAVGAGDIPADMAATLHQGEIVVPKTFADSIRNGEFVMSAKGLSSEGNQTVIVNVYGSVTTENELADAINKNIQKRKVRGHAI